MIRNNNTYTIYACYVGYVVQAIINNLPPLLFLTFQNSLGISIGLIGSLITINFGTQIIVDFAAAKYVDRIGYRPAIVAAHLFCAAGLLCMGILPRFMENAYAGLVIAMVCNAIGGGLLEVLVSPIVEATPSSGAKETAMSLLHSFYCWGHVAVVIFSTIGFQVFGMERWYMLPLLWSIVPFANLFVFSQVPIYTLAQEKDGQTERKLLSNRAFWLFFGLMLCAGASEQAMSQWASLFAEEGLQVSKTVGDLLGPCLFAILMGSARMFYGKRGERIDLHKFMAASAMLCVVSYCMAVFLSNPLLALLGCGLCGLSVGIMWPGAFSLAAKGCPNGGTLMFGLLALAGDVGCAAGPSVVSAVSGAFPEYGIRAGLLAAIVFPLAMLFLLRSRREKEKI
ncbi:MAG: MFS transporter [Lachnospiraceae bacterium]|nr:MFS transporter [Lachnospiraceae bacterium]